MLLLYGHKGPRCMARKKLTLHELFSIVRMLQTFVTIWEITIWETSEKPASTSTSAVLESGVHTLIEQVSDAVSAYGALSL